MNAVQELAAAIRAGLAEDDLPGYLLAWCDVVEGNVSPDDTVTPEPAAIRADTAFRLCGDFGRVSSSMLAQAARVSRETARLTLQELAQAGDLAPVSAQRGRYYTLPRR